MSYVLRLGMAFVAFPTAMNVDKVGARLIGFIWLLLTGLGFLFVGIHHGTVIDMVLGVFALSAAGYSWWYTRA